MDHRPTATKPTRWATFRLRFRPLTPPAFCWVCADDGHTPGAGCMRRAGMI